ncbi:hypothetical protein KEQ76_06350 [Escherichia coli]|uniref:hypothetical protein n=1 Tax=Escherichia coli TaxID=562 RepID=UPI0012FF9D9E|nr:hypothetical protein [Escherichia coli]EFB9747082.1 hypothetical protein [Escherichia coli]EFJ2369162.1 hypothetical protein [Escherichia coli]EJP9078589.1 hypothetical protein [Escherichia coli]MBS9140931.1 hypothetical protein [Escherichia coli]MCV0986101.1 hypothetical protein [Escherichia coli]
MEIASQVDDMLAVGMYVFCDRTLAEIVNPVDIVDALVRRLSPEVQLFRVVRTLGGSMSSGKCLSSLSNTAISTDSVVRPRQDTPENNEASGDVPNVQFLLAKKS